MSFRFLFCFLAITQLTHGFDYYGGSAGPKSLQYTAKLKNNGTTYTPHVYGIGAPPNYTDPKNCNSTDNWIEFEQKNDETTLIIIDRLIFGGWPSNTHIRPISYGINIHFSNSNKTASFNITGNALHLSVHYGDDDNAQDPNGATQSTMLIFVTPPSNDIIPKPTSNTKVFKSGIAYNLTDGGYAAGTGVFAVNHTTNSKTDMIIIERGAIVYGKFFINKSHVNIYGPGIVSGTYFSREESSNCSFWNQCLKHINTLGNKLDMIGITMITPMKAFYDTVNGIIQYYRAIGWQGRNGLGILLPGSIHSDSFIKTYDDNVKFKGGNVTTKNMVIWHGYNGNAFDLSGSVTSSVEGPVFNYNWTIIASENTSPKHYEGINGTGHEGEAIIGLKPKDTNSLIDGVEFHNLVIDGDAKNLFLLQADGEGYVKNFRFYNLMVRGG
eukprot:327589_1